MTYRLGVDVGGTFTDVILVDESSGAVLRAKTPSTPADQSVGVLEGIQKACRQGGVNPRDVRVVMHGTTVATNALLEGRGARVGLVVTKGYRDVLHVARSRTPGPLAGWITMQKPDPPAPLELTVEAVERIGGRGEVVEPLDEGRLRESLRTLISAGVEALTVSLINSFANPDHERRVRDVARSMAPNLPVTISSDVLPEIGEYERTLTASVNAWVRPEVGRYLDGLQGRIGQAGMNARVNILRSDGGLMALDAARDTPVNILLSGPAGGVVGALWVGQQAGFANILTCDVGGTSTDVALCQGGAPDITRQTEVGAFAVRAPTVDVRTIGAGGGSIAHVPSLTRALRVGPRSAGAQPGPAAYGLGGTEPTVADANVVLGYLPERLLGGEMALDVAAAHRAVQSIADALGLDVQRAAAGMIQIANENMLGALRLVSVQRGYDPREFALMMFGGAGPAHGNALGKLLGSWPVVIPPGPGLLNALGDASTVFREEFSRSFIRTFDRTSADELRRVLDDLGRRADLWLGEQDVPRDQRDLRYAVDVRYYRQGHALTLDVDPSALARDSLDGLARQFDEMHSRLYGFSLDTAHEVVQVRAIGVGRTAPLPAPKLARARAADPRDARLSADHRAYFGGQVLPTPLYDRARLQAGHVIAGPAIVVEMDSTTLVEPDSQGTVDDFGNILITRK